jgi:hypothetical protein
MDLCNGVNDGGHCSAVGNDIKALQTKFVVWKDLLGAVNTATDVNFRLKHEGSWAKALATIHSVSQASNWSLQTSCKAWLRAKRCAERSRQPLHV